MPLERAHHRAIPGAQLHGEAVGISLDEQMAGAVPDFVLIGGAGADGGNRQFADSRARARMHHMHVAVPMIELAHHADALGVRRPYRESRALAALAGAQMRAELLVNTLVPALAEQIQIEVGKARVAQFNAPTSRASPPKCGPHIRGCCGRWRNSPYSDN